MLKNKNFFLFIGFIMGNLFQSALFMFSVLLLRGCIGYEMLKNLQNFISCISDYPFHLNLKRFVSVFVVLICIHLILKFLLIFFMYVKIMQIKRKKKTNRYPIYIRTPNNDLNKFCLTFKLKTGRLYRVDL